jgi:cytochrome c oxidase cbb3-type subunit 3
MTESTQHATSPSHAPKDPSEIIHVYDDIEEANHKLPNWWLYTLFGTVFFSIVYWFQFQVFHFSPSPREVYNDEMARYAALEAEKIKAAGVMTPEALAALANDPATVAQGKEVWAANCVACHLESGAGSVGPNLTDKYWLHGGAPDKIHKTITEGVPAKGMVPWGPILGPDRVRAVTAYVLTLKNTNVAGGKAPQGEPDAE